MAKSLADINFCGGRPPIDPPGRRKEFSNAVNAAASGGRAGENRRNLLVPVSAEAILNRMRDVFACSKCHSIYEITRLREKPILPPRCQVCFAGFPPSELDDWLVYERAEPEWTVGEWLTGQTSQFVVPSPDQRLPALAQRRVPTSEWPHPSTRFEKLSPVGRARPFDER